MAETGSACCKEKLGIKIMVKEVQNLRSPEHAPQLYAFVHMDNCEARTRSAKNDAAAANNVVWNQKIAFPACSARSLIIDVADQRPGFSESNPRGLVASKAILGTKQMVFCKCRTWQYCG